MNLAFYFLPFFVAENEALCCIVENWASSYVDEGMINPSGQLIWEEETKKHKESKARNAWYCQAKSNFGQFQTFKKENSVPPKTQSN